jgi:hypothetical protein
MADRRVHSTQIELSVDSSIQIRENGREVAIRKGPHRITLSLDEVSGLQKEIAELSTT